jgi:pyridinium-3,5-bisthiocarboxylic acid mononucleotide nickel chelatase
MFLPPIRQTAGVVYQRATSMRIAYLDCFSGISGDMFLGALVDAGVPFELLEQTVAALHVGATLEMSRVVRNGISAVKIDVVVDGKKDLPREEFWAAETEQLKDHDHGKEHSHSNSRHLAEILKIIAGAPVSERAKQTTGAIFAALGEAEAKVHNVPIEKVHFHEVGAVDAIVDIVCAAVGAEALHVDRILASPLNVGGGTVTCAHGVMPVPAPATLELLKGIPIYSGDVIKELVTPTGAAIVKVLAAEFGRRPLMTTETIGLGAGARDIPRHSNVLRISVGETIDARSVGLRIDDGPEKEIVVLEANLDDLSPQVIGYVTDQVLTEGALDVFTTAVQMKKGRPGTLLTILAEPEAELKLRNLLFRESSTLGIRSRREQRHTLARRHESVQTKWGTIRIKIGTIGDTDSQFAPEYEDCRRIAAEQRVPLKQVMQEALRLYLDKKNG